MKRGLKMLCLILAVGILVTSAAGCSGKKEIGKEGKSVENTAGNTATTDMKSTELPKADIKIVIAGDQPPAQDEVIAEINRVSEKDLNINLQVAYVPWGEYIEKCKVMAAANDVFDIYLNFYSELSGAVSRKQCLPLNELLDQYGPDLKAQIPAGDFEGLKIEGKLYGIPAVYAKAEMDTWGIIIRKDLREKYKLPEITNLETLEKYFEEVKKNEPNMIVLPASKGRVPKWERTWTNGKIQYTFGSDLFKYMTIDFYNKPFKVENTFKSEWFKKQLEWNRKAFKNGWIPQDCLIIKEDRPLFIQGKAASTPGDVYNLPDIIPQLKKNVPEADVEMAILNKDAGWCTIWPTNNFAQISSTSKAPERAMMFMNWLRKSRDNYDLYMYGIKGRHYTLEGDQVKLPDGVDMANRPYAPTPWFTRHEPWHRTYTTDPKAYVDGLNFWTNLKAIDCPLMTFAWNTSNVKVEQAAVDKVIAEFGMPVFCGLLGTDADYQKLLKALDEAGMQKILDDTQKQIDEYAKVKNLN